MRRRFRICYEPRTISVRPMALLSIRGLAELLTLFCLFVMPAFAATYSDNGDGTVTDPRTGLTWMRCTMGQTWTGSICIGRGTTYAWSKATALTTSFAGASDWRLPNIRELQTIIDPSNSAWPTIGNFLPAIDTSIFSIDQYPMYWSATVDAQPFVDNAWVVDFENGISSRSTGAFSTYVRLVRGGQSFASILNPARPTINYIDNGDGTVTHKPTSLMWKRCAEGQSWDDTTCTGAPALYTWINAKLRPSTFAENDDWRLPTEEELLSIVDYTTYRLAVNSTVFPNLYWQTYWSSSPNAHNSQNGWIVYFDDGSTFSNLRGDEYASAILVRGAQPLSPSASTRAPSATTTATVLPNSTTPSPPGYWLNMVSGWNLVGNSTTAVIGASRKFGDSRFTTSVWKWIRATGKWAFYTPTLSDGGAAYAASKGYSFLTSINPGEGFWVNARMPIATFLAGDSVPTSTFSDGILANALPTGWSLIAIGDNKTPQEFANTIAVAPTTTGQVATSLTTLWAWDAISRNWYFYAPSLLNAGTQAAYIASMGYLDFGTANTELSLGTGFWVNKP